MPKRISKSTTQATFEPQKFWCGSQESFEYFMSIKPEARAGYNNDSGDDELPPLWDRQGPVAVVPIRGPLVEGDAGWMRKYGVTGYDNIRQALIEAVGDPDITSIMLDVSSGGGQVAGCSDCARFMLQVRNVKPITTFTANQMASAAYWIGSIGQRITISDTAEVGSVGVLVVHQEYSKALEMNGFKATIIRAGKYKAVTNSVEPLSETGREVLQGQVDYLYQPFLEHVASMRRMTPEAADEAIGQGRVFLGQQSVDAGAADVVGTYQEALAYAMALGEKSAKRSGGVRNAVAQATSMPDNGNILNKGSSMPTPTLSAEQLAALAAGVPVADVGLPAADADTNPDTPNLAAPASDAAPVVDAPAAPVADAQGIEFFRNETKAAQLDLAKAEAKLASLTDENTALKAQAEAMSGIVRQSVGQMSVAMGGTADAGKALAGSDLLAEHTRLADLFKSKFKVGGVVATTPENPEKPKAALVNPLFAALAKSVPAKKE